MSNSGGVGDEVFGPEDFKKSEGHESRNTSTSGQITTNKAISIPKGIKLFALGVVSFTIPVIYYFQANELKKKELKTAQAIRDKESIETRLATYYDTSLQYAKIKAYQTYSTQLIELIKPPAAGNTSDFQSIEIQKELIRLSAQVNNVSDEIASLRKGQSDKNPDAKGLLPQQDFNTIRLINDKLQKPFDKENLKTPFKDTVYFISGQIEQYGKRLSDLRILFDSGKDTVQIPGRRRRFIENQLIIYKTQKTLDSLIINLNSIYQRFPKL
jgi:hypothetical protein